MARMERERGAFLMASGWLKMRMDLQSHPKLSAFVRNASERRRNANRQVPRYWWTACVWSVFDTHSEDGRLYGYTPKRLTM